MTIQQDRESSLRGEVAVLERRVKELEDEVGSHERTRLQLLEAHSFRSAVIERAAEGICVCHSIPDFPFVQFTVWNPRMREITGHSVEDINRLGWYQTMYPDPDKQERARARMSQMREGEDLRYERWEVVRADQAKRTLRISTSLLRTPDSQVHVLGLMEDVTEEELYRQQLETRLTKLEGLLPICSSCKRIRDGEGDWHQIEVYLSDRTQVDFTHGICPECARRLYPQFRR